MSTEFPKRINKTMTLVMMKRTNEVLANYYIVDFDTKSTNKDNAIKNSRKRMCNNPIAREVIDGGYKFYYNYKLSNGVLDYDYYISKEHCK